MTLAVHTFETNALDENLSFAFHETISEGREIYFIAKFKTPAPHTAEYAENIFGSIIDAFTDSDTKNAYDAFEEGLKMANGEITKRKKQKAETPEIVVAFFDFHNLYLSQAGQSEVYLIRDGALSQITETESDEASFSNILSGQITINDIVIISTSRILRVLTSNQLVDMFESNNFTDNISLLKHELRTKTKESILLSVIGVGKQKKEDRAGFLSQLVHTKKSQKKGEIESIPSQEMPLQESDDDAIIADIDSETSDGINQNESQETKTENPYNTETQAELSDDTVTPIHLPKKQRQQIAIRKKIQDWIGLIRKIQFKNTPPKKIIIALGGLFILLIGLISIRIAQNHDSEAVTQVRANIQLSRDTMKQANELLFQGDRKGANELLQSAEDLIIPALNSSDEELRDTARFLKADIERQKLEAENAVKLTPKNIADLGLKNSNFRSIGFNELRGNLYVHNETDVIKTIRGIVENPITITTQEAITASTVRGPQDTLIFLTNTPRIIEYKGGVISPMNTQDSTWKQGIDVDVFGSRFIYILDPVSNQIWKYERRRSDYSNASAYNKSGDLSRAVSMAIDGHIYVLSDNGNIQKLLRGENEAYEFRDLPSIPFTGNKLKLFTSESHSFLYVLDPDNSRVLVFQKGDRFATYRKQIFFETIPEAIDFHINESGQKVNILTEDKIYEFDL